MSDIAEQPPSISRPDRKKVGRKRDASLDGHLLKAAIKVLAEVGYDRMTMDMVADRARAGKATVYRRWASKAELVVDAVRLSARNHVDLDRLPITGTLRGDMLALFAPRTIEDGEQVIRAIASIAALLAQNVVAAPGTSDLIADPWAAAHERLIARAVERGEIEAPADIAAMARVVPAMVTYRAIIERDVIDLQFLTYAIDRVLLPAIQQPRKVQNS